MHCMVAYVLAAAAQVIVKAVTHFWAVGYSTDRHQLILWCTCAHKAPGIIDQKCCW